MLGKYSEGLVMNTKSLAIVSCWASVTIISVIYLVVFGDKIGDILFGVFVPIGILVFMALLVTVLAINSFEKEKM